MSEPALQSKQQQINELQKNLHKQKEKNIITEQQEREILDEVDFLQQQINLITENEANVSAFVNSSNNDKEEIQNHDGESDQIDESERLPNKKGKACREKIQEDKLSVTLYSNTDDELYKKDVDLLQRAWPTNKNKMAASERVLLRHIGTPYRRICTPVNGFSGCSFFTSKCYLNAICIGPADACKSIVLLHGYGAGLGFWFPTMKFLATIPDTKIYALDLLGFGRSSRPKFPSNSKIEKLSGLAESFFVESFEQFREKNGIESFTLIAHSMGGYIGCAYTLLYPERVTKLILVSPGAFPERPQDQTSSSFSSEGKTFPKHPEPNKRFKMLRTAVNWNLTPFSLVRIASFKGPDLIKAYVDRRLHALTPEEQTDLGNYMYHSCARSGSGEYALKAFFLPNMTGLYGVNPMINRIASIQVDTTFMYGDVDWMDVNDGHNSKTIIENFYEDEAMSKNKCPKVEVITIRHAGHNVFLDNRQGFNEKLLFQL